VRERWWKVPSIAGFWSHWRYYANLTLLIYVLRYNEDIGSVDSIDLKIG
jgi:hypothetical protein